MIFVEHETRGMCLGTTNNTLDNKEGMMKQGWTWVYVLLLVANLAGCGGGVNNPQ